ncbi:MAG: glycogen/starch synthase [bacterium]
MNGKNKILFLSAEVTPLAKVGGLGDVAGALPQALNKLGVDIRICLPFYGMIDQKKYPAEKIISRLPAPAGDKNQAVDVWETYLPETDIPVYLIKHDFFNSKEIYSHDLERFSFFTRAALEAAEKLNFRPDIVHANDWHTAMAADFIKQLNRQNSFFSKTKTLYTIHNLANQGITKTKNYMAEGILNSDIINTVSPTYAKEILTKEFGAGLENILFKRKSRLYGILNGIDTAFFNPETDSLIEQKYSQKNSKEKTVNKIALQKQLGLAQNEKTALVGMVSRLVWQKGVDLISEEFSRLDCQFVFLGTGEKKYENALLKMAEKFPSRFSARIKFDEKLAHLIYAGSDMFLMPSRFEPCGLGQMVAMRYGTVPVVRATGGLADTVNGKNGFAFKKYSSQELYKTINKALNVFYKDKKTWDRIKINGMKSDFSWDKSAREYLKIYEKIALTKPKIFANMYL